MHLSVHANIHIHIYSPIDIYVYTYIYVCIPIYVCLYACSFGLYMYILSNICIICMHVQCTHMMDSRRTLSEEDIVSINPPKGLAELMAAQLCSPGIPTATANTAGTESLQNVVTTHISRSDLDKAAVARAHTSMCFYEVG